MGNVGGGEVVVVHLLSQHFNWSVDEQSWVTGASAAPDNVWGLVVIPCGCF